MKIKITALKDVSVFASYSEVGTVRTRSGDDLPAPIPQFGWLNLRAGQSRIIAVFWGINPQQLPGEQTKQVNRQYQAVPVKYDPETDGVREFHGLLRMEPADT